MRGEFGTPKSQRSARSVPLADRVSAALDAHHKQPFYGRDEHLVFAHPERGRPLDRSKLLKRFKAAARHAGVRDGRFHDLRHTFGTRVAAAGVPMRTLQEWMGHRDFKTTLIYADYAPSAHERALIEAAFATRGINRGINLSETAITPESETSDQHAESEVTDPPRSGCGPGGRGFKSRRSPLENGPHGRFGTTPRRRSRTAPSATPPRAAAPKPRPRREPRSDH